MPFISPPAAISIGLDPVAFRVAHFGVSWYGVAVGVAIAAGLLVLRAQARRRRLDPEAVTGVAAWAIVGGLAGARLMFVFDHWGDFASEPLSALALQEGGLAIQGAILGGLGAGVIAARRAGLAVLVLADAAAPAVVLGQAIGRLGCLVTGDAVGGPTSLPWGVTYTNPDSMAPRLGVALQPVFAYEGLLDLAVFGFLWYRRDRATAPGKAFALYLGLYSAGKFALTFLRQERVWGAGLQEAQILAIGLLAVAVGVWVLSALRTRPGVSFEPASGA